MFSLPLVVAAVITVLLVAAHMLPLEWGAILGIALAVVLYVTDVYMLRDRFPTGSGDEGYTIKAMRRVLEGDAGITPTPNRTRNPSESGICLTASGHRPEICSWLSFFACIYICWRGELGSLIQTQMAKLPVRCVVYGAMLLMLIRYWHYSYLKFKYCYEDNVFEQNRTQDAVTEPAASK